MALAITQNGQTQYFGQPSESLMAQALRAQGVQNDTTPIWQSPARPDAGGFNADAYVADMSAAELNNLIGAGPNLATYAERAAAIDAAKRRLGQINPTQVPDQMGMGAAGGQGSNIPDITNPLAMGPGDRGVNEIPIPDDATPPLPGGPGVQDPTAPSRYVPRGTPTQWNWDQAPGAGQNAGGDAVDFFGGADASADVVGEGSPWGTPGVPGNNQDFYRAQFQNLLNQRGARREAEQAAALRRQEAAAAGPQQSNLSWDWLEGGLPEVRVAQAAEGGGEPWTWQLRPGFEGLNSQQVISKLSGQDIFSPKQQSLFQQHFGEGGNPDSMFWTRAGSPDAIINAIGPDANPEWRGSLVDMANALYQRSDITTPAGGGPKAAPGYALPI